MGTFGQTSVNKHLARLTSPVATVTTSWLTLVFDQLSRIIVLVMGAIGASPCYRQIKTDGRISHHVPSLNRRLKCLPSPQALRLTHWYSR